MKYLLDTHIYLWWLADDPTLEASARERIANPRSIVHVSAASIWEIAIKRALGKLELDGDPVEEIWKNGFVELPVHARHARHAGELPRHHDDPFDRMLIAQAQLEQLSLISRDTRFPRYPVRLVAG